MVRRLKFPILVIDPGLKNFGLAWASTKTAVEVLPPLRVSSWRLVIPLIRQLMVDLGIKSVVIGQPEKGRVVGIAQSLAKELGTERETVLYPETLSSQIAWQKLSKSGLKFKEKHRKEHSYAALEILTTFLAGQEVV